MYIWLSAFSILNSVLIQSIIAATIQSPIWKALAFLMLVFGSLLWSIAVIAVLWGFLGGLIPAIRSKDYKRASVIAVILIITVLIMALSVTGQALYLTGFIIPVILLSLYIRRYTKLPKGTKPDFRNN